MNIALFSLTLLPLILIPPERPVIPLRFSRSASSSPILLISILEDAVYSDLRYLVFLVGILYFKTFC